MWWNWSKPVLWKEGKRGAYHVKPASDTSNGGSQKPRVLSDRGNGQNASSNRSARYQKHRTHQASCPSNHPPAKLAPFLQQESRVYEQRNAHKTCPHSVELCVKNGGLTRLMLERNLVQVGEHALHSAPIIGNAAHRLCPNLLRDVEVDSFFLLVLHIWLLAPDHQWLSASSEHSQPRCFSPAVQVTLQLQWCRSTG